MKVPAGHCETHTALACAVHATSWYAPAQGVHAAHWPLLAFT